MALTTNTIMATGPDGGTVPVARAPVAGATIAITTAAASHVNTAITETRVYRITTPVDITYGINGNATAADLDLPVARGIEDILLADGDSLSIFDAGAGGATVKLTPL